METIQNNTEIPLHNKHKEIIAHAQIDSADFENVSKYKWSVTRGYACGLVAGKKVAMHRYIMGNDTDLIVDHIDGNRLNNKRSNLRFVTAQKNAENRKISKSKKSCQFRNVRICTRKNEKHVFAAAISVDGIKYDLGTFKTAEEAAIARDIFIIHNKIETVLNFPEKREHFLQQKCPEIKNKIYANAYRGVYKNEGQDTYSAKITINGSNETACILTHTDALLCAKAYDKYIIDNNIIGKQLNFPHEFPNYCGSIKTLCKEIDENYVGLIIKKKEQDTIVKINKNDYNKVKYYPVHINVYGYASICCNSKSLLLHRFLMNVNDPKIWVDHINSNKLDCTRDNLRLSDSKSNAQNRSKLKKSVSEYIGVSKNHKSWDACIIKNGIKKFRWTNINAEFVARARDIYIMDHLKDDHYKLNFTWTKEEIDEWKIKISDAKENASQK